MARKYIGYTARGATTFRNVRREDGYPIVLMEEGETVKVSLDWSAMLDSGETISSVTASGDGIAASASTSGTTTTLTLSSPAAWGEVTVTATLSSGEVIDRKSVV